VEFNRKFAIGLIITGLLITGLLYQTSIFSVRPNLPFLNEGGLITQEWNYTYGGSGSDFASDLVESTDGGFVLAGSTSSFGAGSNDMWLVKTDENGIILWNQTYGGSGFDAANSLIQASDGGFILAGRTDSFGVGTTDMWLVKTDENGIVQWNQTYGGSGSEIANSIIQARDGGFILAGRTNSFGADPDMWLVKTDENGIVQWNQTYGGSSNEIANSLIHTNDGGFVLAGWTNSFGADPDMWLVKTDENGIVQWNQTYGGSESEIANSLIQTSDGGFVLAGGTNSFGADPDMWLVKTDENGIVQWNQTYGGSGSEIANSIIQARDGGFILAGRTDSFGVGTTDMWLVKTDENGIVQWNQTYGGSIDEIANSIIQTSDGGFVLAGWTNSFGAGPSDMWLVKLFFPTKSISFIDILIDRPRISLSLILIIASLGYLWYRRKKINEKKLDSQLYPNT